MNNLKRAFGQKIKSLRKDKQITQDVFAGKIDLSPRQLIRIENGENFPSADTLAKISKALNTELKKIFDFIWD